MQMRHLHVSFINAYIHTYIDDDGDAALARELHTMHTYIHTYINTYTYINT